MSNLPYVTAHGNITKAIDGIVKAAVPPKVTGDFVKNMLGIKGGSGDQITSFIKKIGLADAGGIPTDNYKRLRNPSTTGSALAEALNYAYKPLFDRNEYVYTLNDDELRGLIVEETGHAHDSNPVKMIFNAFKALNANADFSASGGDVDPVPGAVPDASPLLDMKGPEHLPLSAPKLNIGYNIHLNLPATDDISVFNAIFKSLKENLLVDDDK